MASFTQGKTVRFWQIIALVFFITTINMTALWMVAKPSQQPMPLTPKPANPSIFELPCPRQPPLFELPNPLPKAIKDSLTLIDNHLKSLAKTAQNKSAISVNIFYRDKVIWRGHYGSKVYEGSNAPDDDTRYRIGSVTKIFPVMLLYKLYQDGTITSLDDPLNKYAPNFHINNPFTGTNITLRQIAGQMSGLPREAPCAFSCINTTSSEQLDFLRSQNLVIEPWTSPSYSNLGYALLGRLLTENLLNITFEEWVTKQVLQPLDMKNTGFEITKKVLENMALPYGPDGKQVPFINLGWLAPAGGMYSTTNDLMKLAKMFTTADGQGILNRESIRQILLPEFITRDGLWLWGSPWEMRFVNGFVAREKNGLIDSYATTWAVIPELKLAVSVLVSSVSPFRKFVNYKIADMIHSSLLPALNESLFNLEKKASFPIDPKPFLGQYLVTQRHILTGNETNFNITFDIHNGKLVGMIETEVEIPPFRVAVGVILSYIDQPLAFQAEALKPKNHIESCFKALSGEYSIFTFNPFDSKGLSGGFSAPAWKISGNRIY